MKTKEIAEAIVQFLLTSSEVDAYLDSVDFEPEGQADGTVTLHASKSFGRHDPRMQRYKITVEALPIEDLD